MSRLMKGRTTEDAHLSWRATAVLGAPSLLLGAAPLLAPAAFSRLIGLPGTVTEQRILRLFGARELLVAAAFVSRRSPRLLWGFLVQDGMDLPLGAWVLFGHRRVIPSRFRVALAVYTGLALFDVYSVVTRAVWQQGAGADRRRSITSRDHGPSSSTNSATECQ